ncbi:MAG: hypothetical protein GAK37_01831 [Pseudomonas sp.]|nr:MAG: hypothetical protein GAK37_01831 [Pseudomonas sp.]
MNNPHAIDAHLEDWNDVRASTAFSGILIGNGASRAVWEDFAYDSLFENARTVEEKPLSASELAVFDALQTRSFEQVLGALKTTSRVNKALAVSSAAPRNRYYAIKEALINTLHGVHIPWRLVEPSLLASLHQELSSYPTVFTSNYDLLNHWATLHAPGIDDLFNGPDARFDLRHTATHTPRILYLHGGLHLVRNVDGTARKLTATDEDVAYIDPVAKTSSDLAWGLDDFFNRFLCEQESLDALIPPSMVETASKECGPLQAGEVYEIDPMLFAMQMLRVGKADALALHKRLRDAVDPPQPVAAPPDTVGSALPAAERPFFEGMVAAGLTGLYLSSYIDWHRMLALQADGQFRLLFWRIHHQTFDRIEVRAYTGPYQLERTAAGDDVVTLDIKLRGDSLGSDANDTQLIVVADPERPLLLRVDELADIAGDIENRQIMGRSEYYFRRVTLAEPWSDEPSDGRAPPPASTLPAALRAHIRDEPLRMSITHVSPPNPDEEDDGEGTVMCTLDLGQNGGLRKNMPLYSPAETGRGLKGWVWTMDPYACQAGIRYRRGPDGEIEHGPQVGDVLSSQPG